MRVLLFHGYMLRGTGSNIYNANLARALARLGHEVHLLCQDREIKIDGVQIHNPDIGGLLPVYVKDPYEGFEVKTFPELTEAELDHYIDANVAAVREVADAAGGIDAALANHLVMGPAILARAGRQPLRRQDPRLRPRVHGQTAPPLPSLRLRGDGSRLRRPGRLRPHRRVALGGAPRSPGPAGPRRASAPRASTSRSSAPALASAGLVVFVGKLIVSKGVDLLLAAWPLVQAAHPQARLQVAGFGEYEDGLRRLLAALERGDLDDAREVARLGWALEGGEEKPLPILSAFLADPPAGYAEAARAAAGSVEFIGRLEHDEVAELFPQAEAVVMPSTFPEAFGMVAVEAAACGALPVSAGHSGMLEVSAQLSRRCRRRSPSCFRSRSSSVRWRRSPTD